MTIPRPRSVQSGAHLRHLATDRSHVFNLSWNAFLPDAVRKAATRSSRACSTAGSSRASRRSRAACRSGSASPARPAATDMSQAYYGTPDIPCSSTTATSDGLAPVYTCDPRLDGRKNGEKFLDINCIGFPAFGEIGEVLPPYDLRTPTRMNHDLTLFKNFPLKGDQKLQFRVGLLQHLQPGVRDDGGDAQRHRPAPRDHVQPHGGQRAERRGRHGQWRLRSDAAASRSRRTRSATSARSTCCADGGSSSSRSSTTSRSTIGGSPSDVVCE